jgi:hypothetical protein
MADKRKRARENKPFVSYYTYGVPDDKAPDVADPCAVKAICPECHGTGRIELLVSVVTCLKCEGSGKSVPEKSDKPRDRLVEENLRHIEYTTTWYDGKGRPIAEHHTSDDAPFGASF